MSEQKTRKQLLKETLQSVKDVESIGKVLNAKLEALSDEEWERWGAEQNSDMEFILQEAIGKMNNSVICIDMLNNLQHLSKNNIK